MRRYGLRRADQARMRRYGLRWANATRVARYGAIRRCGILLCHPGRSGIAQRGRAEPGPRVTYGVAAASQSAPLQRMLERDDFRHGEASRVCRARRLAPVPVLRRQGDEDAALRVGGDVGEKKLTLAFFRTPLPQGKQPAQTAIGLAVCRVAQQAWRVLQIEPHADNKAQICILGGYVGTHHAGKGVAVGDGDGRKTQRLGLPGQFLGVRGAPQEGEVGGYVQLRIGHG